MPYNTTIPLSLYIHLPWCIKKCPYCDFNSHKKQGDLPEQDYIDTLIKELDAHLPAIWGRRLCSIFIGGGTPSLFSASSIDQLLSSIQTRIPFHQSLEITLEANPGTAEQTRFCDYRQAGINRLSIGVQSFQADKLASLGRIHDADEASRAIDMAKKAGFNNMNIDLMFGLPTQSLDDALFDLCTAIDLNPTHISWYQLTIEPNTFFHHKPPNLPNDDTTWAMQEKGHALLAEHGFKHYEVSAFSKTRECKHNRNYWEFGDYLGLGAGAHSKITRMDLQCVTRHSNVKNPKDYLNPNKPPVARETTLLEKDLMFEFMLNTLRLNDGFSLTIFEERTGLSKDKLTPHIKTAIQKKLLSEHNNQLKPTALGRRFLNDLMAIFL